ncbi:class I glutamine amidotransferase-like protein [Bombardia bombarda]|uniref:Class I glutamine amidotransferase-like protein n=1 Tax=Bombardia bombarda TaxID=252184 RepID=A0AA39WN27_9PEZI|nr:class I glutamine amidotransferase-like protein [Bombardia bombarda]
MATSDSRKTVRIGVFIPTEAQLLDTACIDVFGSMSYEYQSGLSYMIPETIYSLAPSVSISYISTIKPGELIRLTGSMKVACTHHLSDPEVQPGQLDIVLIPGPDPRTAWEAAVTDWVAGHAATEGTDILSVCSGIFVCGAAGILKGKKACGPRGLQSQLKKQFEDVTWLGDELRWIQDGNIWSSGTVSPFFSSRV